MEAGAWPGILKSEVGWAQTPWPLVLHFRVEWWTLEGRGGTSPKGMPPTQLIVRGWEGSVRGRAVRAE